MSDIQLPKNIPFTQIMKYESVIQKGYDEYLKLIYSLGSYITYGQFYELFKMNNKHLSESYSKQKANNIIKVLENLKFIKSDTIGKHKYFYLSAPSLAIAIGDYSKIPKTNHKNISLKNNKFTTHLMKVEYYLEYGDVIGSETLFKHLKAITRNIIQLTEKHNLDYNIGFLRAIYNSSDYKKVKEAVSKLPEEHILYIVWVNLYELFNKLLCQGQTVSTSPIYFKLNVNKKKLLLHYIPEIIIFDIHKANYYQTKMNRLLHDFINIKSNDVNGLRKRFTLNESIGSYSSNIIGYGLKVIGTDQKSLSEKLVTINSYGENNNNSPFVSSKSVFLDLSTYFSYSYRKIDVVEKIDCYVEALVANKLNEILNSVWFSIFITYTLQSPFDYFIYLS